MRKIKLKEITTPRLIIRLPQFSDAHFMFYNWASDQEVTKYLSWSPHESLSVSELLIKTWMNSDNVKSLNWVIESRSTKETIGTISLFNIDYAKRSCEVGYCLSRFYWNQGLMTECLKYILKFAFKKGIKLIEGRCHHDNVASIKVLTNNGFRFVEEFKIVMSKNNHEEIIYKYQLTYGEWKKREV